jgi:hypothetical protein
MEVMPSNVQDRVVALLRTEHALDDAISARTRLREDLQMDGDDAVEFIGKFSAQFDVDLGTFQFDRFFNDESHVFWSPAGMLGRLLRYHREPTGSITVKHLTEVASKGRWIDPVVPPLSN